jgi:hypothetical protein
MVPTKEELLALTAEVARLDDEKNIAWNMRDRGIDAMLNHALAQHRWAQASNKLSDRIREYIASGAHEAVRP